MTKALIIVAVAGLAMAGCTGGQAPTATPSTTSSTAAPSTTAPPPPVSVAPSPSLPGDAQTTATLVYSSQGKGSIVLTPKVTSQVVSVRFTCVGTSKSPSIKSVGGGTILRTSGCLAGEIFGATFTRSTRLNPSKITLTVDPDTYWQIQVWAGKYVQHFVSPLPSTAASA